MRARRQVTNKLREAYQGASKPDKGRILDEVVVATGMARSSARRLLVGPRLLDPREQVDKRQFRARSYSDASRDLLTHVWLLMGMPCGKYFVVMLPQGLPLMLEARDLDRPFTTADSMREVASMSAATIDRYLAPVGARFELKGKSATRAGLLLRNSISIMKTGDELADVPGMLECDTVVHCGPTLVGEFARTLTMTDMSTGWTECASIRNNASKWILEAVQELRGAFPFPVTCFDSDNGSEFINHDVVAWVLAQDIAFTRSRPYKKNDQATVESKKNHVVRKHAFYWRYDTLSELSALNRLWRLVNDRLNYLTPTRKPIGFGSERNGKQTRIYDSPATPMERLLTANVLSRAQKDELTAYRDSRGPAQIARDIAEIQRLLVKMANEKTDQLHLAGIPSDLRDARKGIRVKAS